MRMRPLTGIAVSLCLTLSCPPVLFCADQETSPLKNRQDDFALARKILQHAAEIAVSQAKVEDAPVALETAAKIGDPKRTVLTVADIAAAQTMLGEKPEAIKTFQQAHALAASLKEKYDQAYAFGKIAELEAKSHNVDAISTFAQAIQIATTLPTDHEKASVLFYVGTSQLDSGHVQAAAATFRESSRFLAIVPDDFRKWVTAFQLAPFQVRAGDDEGALTTANHLADQKEHPFKSQVLSSVATGQAQRGNVEAALKTSSAIEDETEKRKRLASDCGGATPKRECARSDSSGRDLPTELVGEDACTSVYRHRSRESRQLC